MVFGLIVLQLALWGSREAALESECLIVVAKSSPIDRLSLAQLRGIFLKKIDRVARVHVVPVQFKPDNPTRKIFEARVFGSHFDVENYWLEQRIQAGERPPVAVADCAFMLLFVERNPGYIGYVPASMRSEIAQFKIKTVDVTSR